MAGAITPIAVFAAEVAKIVGRWQATSEARRMRAAIEAGEKYIQTNESTSLVSEKKTKYLKHYKKRFFKYN